jgi:dTDP-4-dehydrorhamnose 3,5-epimerase
MEQPGILISFADWPNGRQTFGFSLAIYLDINMPIIEEHPSIHGVYLVHLRSHADQRGQFTEIFRKEWFPQRSWNEIQSNRSVSEAGVLRGLHYHHHQVDYWLVLQGTLRAGLVDLRQVSPTQGNAQIIQIEASDNLGLYIPSGVAHGFLGLTRVTLLYVVDNYYDGSDEYGVAWDDPEINLEWGVQNPNISNRDRENPRLADISESELPK